MRRGFLRDGVPFASQGTALMDDKAMSGCEEICVICVLFLHVRLDASVFLQVRPRMYRARNVWWR